ncbi:MAG: DUF763 domain-containing protein [Candidatus Omnitrophica bacterium]|nr:DUF763 domain-containing protein [Candidatus Omnitrophota bacterium]
MMQRGFATFSLDTGICPRWLFERMVKLGSQIVEIIIREYGAQEFVKRVADPVWFQSLGTVLAFDWNSSGLTTILTAALKEAIRGKERSLGLFICGGKGRTSRKTPQEIEDWGSILGLPTSKVENLVYNSRMSAKVDSCLVQDGFQIYHHSFFFTKEGTWSVVQQGMNTSSQTARRYHWYSENIEDLVCQPHSGIITQIRVPTLNLVAKESQATQKISTELVQGGFKSLMKDIEILRKHSDELSGTFSFRFRDIQFTFLNLEDREFFTHPVLEEDFFQNIYLKRILYKLCEYKPKNYESLVAQAGVGPKTVRALSLISEVIYGAKPSYEDPAQYSFAHGGKDRTPYPVDRKTYDASIDFFMHVVNKMKLCYYDKNKIISRLIKNEKQQNQRR